MNKKNIKKIILDSLAIIFLAISCILNSISIFKLGNRINNIENKIVETKGIKKANNVLNFPYFTNSPVQVNINVLEVKNGNYSILDALDYFAIVLPAINYITDNETNKNDERTYFLMGGINYENNELYSIFLNVFEWETNNVKSPKTWEFSIISINLIEEHINIYLDISRQGDQLTIVDTDQEIIFPNSLEEIDGSFISYGVISAYNNPIELSNGMTTKDIFYLSNVIENKTTILSSLLDAIGDVASGFMAIIISLFTNALSIFYINNELTFLGVVLMFIVAVPLTYWVINFVISMVRKIRVTRGK